MKVCVTSFLLLAFFLSTAAYAATYSWTDEKGTIHFTEDPGSVPEKIRSKAGIVGEEESSPEERPASKEPVKAPETAPVAAPSGGNGNNGIYAGKSREEWQNELAGREAAMTKLRSRIDEIAALLKGYSGEWEEQKKLLLEYNSSSARLKEMKADYFRQVEKARKAGLPVDIQE